MTDAAITAVGLTKRYGAVTAVEDLSFDVARRRGHRVPRAQRRRQDHDPADGARPGRARRRATPPSAGRRYVDLDDPARRSAPTWRSPAPSGPLGPQPPAFARRDRPACRARAPRTCCSSSRSPGAADRASASTRWACASGWAWPQLCSAIPQVLVLDEPANGLDPQGIRWLRDLLRSLAGGGPHGARVEPRAGRGRADRRRRGRHPPRQDGAPGLGVGADDRRLWCGCAHRLPTGWRSAGPAPVCRSRAGMGSCCW